MAGFLASHSAHMKRSIDVSLGTLFASSGAEDWIAKSMRYREEASQLSRARIQEPSSPGCERSMLDWHQGRRCRDGDGSEMESSERHRGGMDGPGWMGLNLGVPELHVTVNPLWRR